MLSFFKNGPFSKEHDMIVFSDVRWTPLSKYPQQVVLRLAKQKKILFVEEPLPLHFPSPGKEILFSPQKNVTVLQPRVSHEQITQQVPLLLAKQLRRQKMRNPVLWFYSSLYSEIIPYLNYSLIICDYTNKKDMYYDAQSEYLLSVADVVITGNYIQSDKNLSSATFWEESTHKMHQIINQALKRKSAAKVQHPKSFSPLVPQLTSRR